MSDSHTARLRYRWWERLHFRVLGVWPDSVVDRRLHAEFMDTHGEAMRQIWARTQVPQSPESRANEAVVRQVLGLPPAPRKRKGGQR